MHAFDLAKVKDNHIIVRRANPGETITTLDGKERALTPDMLMIADQTNATGIAGVMGGEESEIIPRRRPNRRSSLPFRASTRASAWKSPARKWRVF